MTADRFELFNYLGVIVSASQNGVGVNLLACGPRRRTAVMISPDEARELAEALVDLAGAADRTYESTAACRKRKD